jgi:hypothetical protein
MVTRAKTGVFRPRHLAYLSHHVFGLIHALIISSSNRTP